MSNDKTGGSIILTPEGIIAPSPQSGSSAEGMLLRVRKQLARTEHASRFLAQRLDRLDTAYKHYCRGDHSPETLELFLAAVEGILAKGDASIEDGAPDK